MKDLTIRQARAKVRKLANGRYHSVRKEWTERKDFVTGKPVVENECAMYIDGTTYITEPTFKEALIELEKQMEALKR